MATKSELTLIVAMMVIAVVGSITATGALTSSKTIGNTGSLKAINVEVYSDSASTQAVTSIDWGVLEPGSVINKTVYVKNTGNTALTLSMSTSGWNPTAANNYITLSWNREGTKVNPGSVVSASLQLKVSSSISGVSSFSFNIIIQGTS